MSRMQPKPVILIIRPPLSIPGEEPEQWAAIRSALGVMPVRLNIDDAAGDFFKQVLMGGDHGRSHADRFNQAGGRFLSSHPWTCEELLEDSQTISQALASASEAFPPCQFHRNGFAHRGLDSFEDLLRFANDTATNPFRQYADHFWEPFQASAPPDMAVMVVGQAGEMGSAMTLATVWLQRWPDIPLILACPESIADEPGRTGPSPGHWPAEAITGVGQLQQTTARLLSLDGNFEIAADDRYHRFERNKGLPLVADHMQEVVQAALKKGRPLVVWRDCGEDPAAVSSQLYAASRLGIWNHLILHEKSREDLRQFAAANANIVHSYCHEVRSASKFSDPAVQYPSAPPGYGRTEPLPGRPLWMALQDPMLIGRLLSRHQPKTLMRLRVRDDGRSRFEVGQRLSYHFKAPTELPAGYLDEIVRMVEAGGSVNTQFVRHNLERAYLIAYAEEEGVIIGNSSLKRPRREYIDAVSRQSGIDLHHYLERGYTSVRPEYRGLGIGANLLEGLTQRAGGHKIFSVIAETNVATQKMAMRNRTRRVATFFSQRVNKEMSVWIPEWMLPEGVELPPQPALGIGQSGKKDEA